MAYLDPAQPAHQQASNPTPEPFGADRSVARPRRRRSIAWVYYTILAVIGVVGAFSVGPSTLLPAVLCGAYATYLYRGGRIVFWIW